MDFIFPSALVTRSRKIVLYSSVHELQMDTLPFHTKMVFLPVLDRAELQRCASQKIPCMVTLHSLQNAVDALKLSGLSFVHVNMNGPPIIDYAWMTGAKNNSLEVVFSLRDLREAFAQKNTNSLMEFRKIAFLLSKEKIPLHVGSFARKEEECISPVEQASLLHYLGYVLSRGVVK
ncbi:MAG: hypothetical protein V1776_00955 [Candidatus Diapherotrites archaeon]